MMYIHDASLVQLRDDLAGFPEGVANFEQAEQGRDEAWTRLIVPAS